MKILALNPYYPPHIGGLEKYSEELLNRLGKEGNTITIFTSALPRTTKYIEMHDSVTVYRFPAWEIVYNYPLPNIFSFVFWKLILQARQERFDVVISVTRFFFTTPLAYCISRARRIPWLHIEHGSGFVISSNLIIRMVGYVYDKFLSPFLFARTSLTVAPSISAKEFVLTFDERNVPVIYRGFDYAILQTAQPRLELKHKYGKKPIITYAGRFIASKGISDLLQAFAQVARKTPAVLLLIGNGNQKDALLKEVRRLDIGESVEFLHELPPREVLRVFKVSDIVVNPSYTEGLPTVVLEAAACGTAIIATNVGGTSEIVQHKTSALLYPPHSIDSLVKNIHTLLEDPDMRARLGRNAQNSVRDKFNWDSAIQNYLHHLHSIT